MRPKKPVHGGRRVGAGRKPSPESMRGVLRVRMPQEEIEALRAHVGAGSVSEFVRGLVMGAVRS